MFMYSKLKWQAGFSAHVMRQGGVIAHPTEAVWGLACDPFSEQAVDYLLALKGRPVEKGLILVSSNVSHFSDLLSPLSSELRARFLKPQTRPTTWIVPDINNQVPVWIKGMHSGVAVRLSDHPVINALSQAFGGVIISTSANPAGKVPAMNVRDIRHYFKAKLDYVVSGLLGGEARPSQIIDLESGRILRQ
ncbi:MAG: L-threonylcarbamoyladenylate synthase [Oleiphilaceae bacterium]|jgi:L-threonylcarbamoyladenylate synthase